MLSVLLVDDEPPICTLIESLINWNELNLKLAGVAYDGIRACQMIQETQPDIVITDIQIPGINGIDLIEKLHMTSPMTSFLIISGYRRFEYAKKAIDFGVEEYLVKPIKKEELNNILFKICARKNNKNIQNGIGSIELNIAIKKKWGSLFYTLPNRSKDETQIILSEIISDNSFKFKNGSYFAGLLKADLKPEVIFNKEVMEKIGENISDIIIISMEKLGLYIERIVHEDQVFLIFNYPGDSGSIMPSIYKVLTDILSFQLLKHSGLYLTLSIGNVVMEIANLDESVYEAWNLMRSRMWSGLDTVLIKNRLKKQLPNNRSFLSFADLQNLLQIIDILDINLLNNWIRSIIKKYDTADHYPLEILDVAVDIEKRAAEALTNLGIPESELYQIRNDFSLRLLNALSTEEIYSVLSSKLSAMFENGIKYKSIVENKPVRKAKTYIQDNYAKHLSLEEISDKVYLAPTYLSTIFKRETGINLSDYIIEVRISHAKEMLENTSLGISEIADQVGYSDTRYFSKLFAKVVGINPKDYRRIHS